jgi:hypothetical protein
MAHIENNVSQELSLEISLNSVSKSYPNGNGGFTHDFTSNSLWKAHTTGEVKRKSLTTQPELSDEEIYAQPVESTPTEGEGEDEGENGDNPQEPQTEGGDTPAPQTEGGDTPSGDQPSNP